MCCIITLNPKFMDAQSRLLMIDGMAVVYRAFHAIRSLTTRDGRPTNALYGFIRMTQQLRRHWDPTHEVVVFDGGLPEERLLLLPSYKAQREEMPDALRAQLEPINEYLAASRIASLYMEGEEADDLMATLAVQSAAADVDVLMATSDKDLFQLVGDRVCIVPPAKSEERMGPAEVYAKTGVQPHQIVDWLSMIGDAADNIPGVPGIGSKTAAKLLSEFGDIQTMYEQIDAVKPDRTRWALQEHRDTVLKNIQMTRLRCDLEIVQPEKGLSIQEPDHARLLAFYRSMDLHTLATELENASLFDF